MTFELTRCGQTYRVRTEVGDGCARVIVEPVKPAKQTEPARCAGGLEGM
jgi:hypothetical protein